MDLRNELLNLDNKNSVIRETFEKDINLMEIPLEHLVIPEYFCNNSFYPDSEKSLLENALIMKKLLAENGFDIKLIAGLHEAIRNAYQHGNNKNPKKKIIFQNFVDKKNAQFFVGDEGGRIHPDFFPYVLRYRTSKDYSKSTDFYNFSSKRKLPENSGIGLMTMHLVFDNVRFFKDISGGLLTYLEKNK